MTHGLRHQIVRGDDVASALGAGWDACVARSPAATVFQTSQWYRAWMKAVAAAEGATPLLLRVGAPGEPRGGLALQSSAAQGSERTLRPLSWPWADYHDAVGDPEDPELRHLLGAALTSLISEEKCPLVLDDVVPGGLLEATLRELGAVEEESSTTSAIDLMNEPHLERVLGKYEHAVKRRRALRLGPLECRHLRTEDEIMRRMPRFIEMHRARWNGREEAVAAFDGTVIDAGFVAMVESLAPHGFLCLTEMTLSGGPIAMYFGFTYRRRYGAYRTAFASELRRLSPGHLMLREMVTHFRALGFRHFDFMRGDYAYKRDYANLTSRNRRFTLGAAPS